MNEIRPMGRELGASRWLLPSLLAALTLGLSATASAQAPDLYGYGARGAAMGGALTAAAADFSAVFYNPAAMLMQEDSQVALGFLLSANSLQIALADRPPGYDPPDLGSSSPAVPYSYRLRERQDTTEVPPLQAFYVGAVTQLGLKDLRLGIAAFLPLDGLGDLSTSFADEREQYFSNALRFERQGQELRSQHITLAAAYALTSWLNVGLGVAWQLAIRSDVAVYLDNPADQSQAEMNLDVGTDGRFALQFGALATPLSWLRLGFSFRDESWMEMSGDNEVQVRGFQTGEGYPLFQKLHYVLRFVPRRSNLGLAFLSAHWVLAVDLDHANWSRYRGHHGDFAGFEDTWTPRVGLEWLLSDSTRLWAGGSYEPSPVPDQTGRTSYVDTDRLNLSTGFGHSFRFSGRQLDANLFLSLALHPWRKTHKEPLEVYPACGDASPGLCDEVPDDTLDPQTGAPLAEAQGLQTGNPGFPGYVAGGWDLATGAELRWKF